MTKLKNHFFLQNQKYSNCDKTQQLKLQLNSKTQIVTKLKQKVTKIDPKPTYLPTFLHTVVIVVRVLTEVTKVTVVTVVMKLNCAGKKI